MYYVFFSNVFDYNCWFFIAFEHLLDSEHILVPPALVFLSILCWKYWWCFKIPFSFSSLKCGLLLMIVSYVVSLQMLKINQWVCKLLSNLSNFVRFYVLILINVLKFYNKSNLTNIWNCKEIILFLFVCWIYFYFVFHLLSFVVSAYWN